RSGMLAPAKARFDSGILVLIGLENVGIWTALRADCGGQHGPSIVLFRVGQGLDRNHETIARLHRLRVGLRRTAPPSPARTARVGDDTLAYRMIPPRVWTATTPARRLVLTLRDSRFSIRFTGKPARLHMLDMLHDGFGFLRLRSGIGLGLLLRQLT